MNGGQIENSMRRRIQEGKTWWLDSFSAEAGIKQFSSEEPVLIVGTMVEIVIGIL